MSAGITVAVETPDRVKGCCVTPEADRLPRETAARTAAILKAIADPTRIEMLHLLRAAIEPICVCDFTSMFDVGQPTVSHHLARLREAGFVASVKRGVWAFYHLRSDMPADVRAALDLVP